MKTRKRFLWSICCSLIIVLFLFQPVFAQEGTPLPPDATTPEEPVQAQSVPAAFDKLTPLDTATGLTISPELTWEFDVANSYEYCVTTTPPVLSQETCDTGWVLVGNTGSATTAAPLYSTIYYWQVKATNVDGSSYANGGAWWSFETMAEPPVITGLNPTRVGLKTPGFTLTVNGTGFTSDAVVLWAGTPLTTTFVSDTQLTAVVLAGLIPGSIRGTPKVKIVNITVVETNGTSNAWPLTIDKNPKPVLVSLSILPTAENSAPVPVRVYDPPLDLHVYGSKFSVNSVIVWNGKKMPTQFISHTELATTIPTNMFLHAKPYSVKVHTPREGGGASGRSIKVMVINPVPELHSVTPDTVLTGTRNLTLTLDGDLFIKPVKVYWNGVRLSSHFINRTTLTVRVPNRLLRFPGVVTIFVVNKGPGGGASLDTKTVTIGP